MPQLVSINTNPALRLMLPLVMCKIGKDEFKTGDGYLMSASVSLGEGERSSRCEFTIYDPQQYYTQKYLQASYDQNGLVGLPPPITSLPTTGNSGATALGSLTPERKAFLDMIAYSEGADYDVEFTGKRFSSYADHPRQVQSSGSYRSDAAGRYQFLSTTWDGARQALGLSDFSPQSQDRACLYLIQNRGALADVDAGNFESAVTKCNGEWASLPGSPYGQPTHSMSELRAYYNQRLAAYRNGAPEQASATRSTQTDKAQEQQPTETANKGTQITISLGYEPEQMVEFAFIHTGTRFKGMDSKTLTFEGQSIRWTMTRRLKNATYQQVTLKQLAQKVAASYGLTLQMTEDGPTYEHLDQTGITDYQLLKRECDRIGYRIYDAGAILKIEPRTNKPLGFVLSYGVNMDSFEVNDQAQRDVSQRGGTASQPDSSSTTGEIKTTIDPMRGTLEEKRAENKGAAGKGTGAKAQTGASTPAITPKTTGKTDKQDQAQREATQRIKGFPGSATFTTTPAALTVTPDTPFLTEGHRADFLNRAWVVECVEHSYQNGNLHTTIKFYSPMKPKPGELQQASSSSSSTSPTITASGCNARIVQAAQQARGRNSSAGPAGGREACAYCVNNFVLQPALGTTIGSNPNYVPSVEEGLIAQGAQRISADQAQPGDIVIAAGQAHIGVCIAPGRVLSNSSSRASYCWESSINFDGYYGGTSTVYRVKC